MAGKFGNRKTSVGGISFSSKLEANVFLWLKRHYKIIDVQPKVYLTSAKILYKPDFLCDDRGDRFFVEAKGYETAVWRLKKRLWAKYGSLPLWIVMSKNGILTVTEIVKTHCDS